jgi:hypothetical protein
VTSDYIVIEEVKEDKIMRVTRGNDFKLYKKRFRLDVARYSFGNRVTGVWNTLPNDVILSKSLNTFKGQL